jgi:hypothetical protein
MSRHVLCDECDDVTTSTRKALLPAPRTTLCPVRRRDKLNPRLLLLRPAVLKEARLVEYALRVTLSADATSLQFLLPPAGEEAPAERDFPGDGSVVDALLITSMWVVHTLRGLAQVSLGHGICIVSCGLSVLNAKQHEQEEEAEGSRPHCAHTRELQRLSMAWQDAKFRGLASLGIGAVGGVAVSAFDAPDAARFAAIAVANASRGPLMYPVFPRGALPESRPPPPPSAAGAAPPLINAAAPAPAPAAAGAGARAAPPRPPPSAGRNNGAGMPASTSAAVAHGGCNPAAVGTTGRGGGEGGQRPLRCARCVS